VRGRAAVLRDGEMEGGIWWASMAQGLITEVDTCANVISGIIAEAEQIIASRLQGALA
jgi:nitronate monooxygenase